MGLYPKIIAMGLFFAAWSTLPAKTSSHRPSESPSAELSKDHQKFYEGVRDALKNPEKKQEAIRDIQNKLAELKKNDSADQEMIRKLEKLLNDHTTGEDNTDILPESGHHPPPLPNYFDNAGVAAPEAPLTWNILPNVSEPSFLPPSQTRNSPTQENPLTGSYAPVPSLSRSPLPSIPFSPEIKTVQPVQIASSSVGGGALPPSPNPPPNPPKAVMNESFFDAPPKAPETTPVVSKTAAPIFSSEEPVKFPADNNFSNTVAFNDAYTSQRVRDLPIPASWSPLPKVEKKVVESPVPLEMTPSATSSEVVTITDPKQAQEKIISESPVPLNIPTGYNRPLEPGKNDEVSVATILVAPPSSGISLPGTQKTIPRLQKKRTQFSLFLEEAKSASKRSF